MVNKIKIKKGLDIPLSGEASDSVTTDGTTSVFAVVPDDFPGYTWKVAVKAGDTVRIGDQLLYAKEDEDIRLVSPVAGTVTKYVAENAGRSSMFPWKGTGNRPRRTFPI